MNDTLITVVGRIVDVPKRRVTDAGLSVTNFRVASTQRRFERDSGQWVDGDSLFLNVSCWRRLADNVARSLIQGDPVVVRGRIFTREYEHDGQKRKSFDMVAGAIGPDLNWGQVEFRRQRQDPTAHEVIQTEPEEPAEEEPEEDYGQVHQLTEALA